MQKHVFHLILLFTSSLLFAQSSFEGIFSVAYNNESNQTVKTEIKVKDQMVYIKQQQGGVDKYDHYILNFATRDFLTLSQPDKKVAIKYHVDRLLDLYEKENLKEGFKRNSELVLKETDKAKEENGEKLTRYAGENSILKGAVWNESSSFNFNQLVPVLRLMNGWNDLQLSAGVIVEGEETNKVSKKVSSVKVVFNKQSVSLETFALPKGYSEKDFAKIMEEKKSGKDLKVIVKSFGGF